MFSGNEEDVQPLWFDNHKVYDAWNLLVQASSALLVETAATDDGDADVAAAAADDDDDDEEEEKEEEEQEVEAIPETLRYDIVNTGREYLAKVSNALFLDLANATTSAAVAHAGAMLKRLSSDLDKLLCSDPDGFDANDWIGSAIALGGTAAEKKSLEWAARAQPTTWLPACDADQWPTPSGNVSNQVTGTCGTRSDLADYSNKQWGGLLAGFYSPRQQCYVQIVAKRGLPVASSDADYNICLDQVAWTFQHDFGSQKLPLCADAGDTVTIARSLLAKYKPNTPS